VKAREGRGRGAGVARSTEPQTLPLQTVPSDTAWLKVLVVARDLVFTARFPRYIASYVILTFCSGVYGFFTCIQLPTLRKLVNNGP
jgi:hypothetical protein